MTDYERIAEVIHYLDACYPEQPALSDIASRVGLSPTHFQKLFSRWAGVSPKVFIQCLTFEHAKRVLQEGGSVLDASMDAGLSGPGRLHDLSIKLEAASPGEIKSGGEGWSIYYGLTETLFGKAIIAQGPRGLCHLAFGDDEVELLERVTTDWPNADLISDNKKAGEWAERIFISGGGDLKACVKGTPFQLKVWRALLEIPQGSLSSYGELSSAIGNPKAARAVGTAVGANRIAWLIPCHRVIRDTGAIGGYRWGTTRKKVMIAYELSGSR